MKRLPSADVLDKVRDIPIYRASVERGHFPILKKPETAQHDALHMSPAETAGPAGKSATSDGPTVPARGHA
ncbi:hypothetical protein GCM10018791_26580 [Streptomyces zaomyceticus]|nr:hypothetical protein GCM10018791_26580 [Streptomyces zaomyceticus]